MQNAVFFQEVLRQTQGPYVGSHKGSPARDFGGQGSGKDKVYAPFDARVVRTRRENGEVYIESLAPVVTPSGRKEIVNMLFIHDSNIMVTQGQIIKQGQHFYTEGGQGSGKAGAFANHLHVEGGFGKSPARQVQNTQGTYMLPGAVPLEDLLFVPAFVPILASGGTKWAGVNTNKEEGANTSKGEKGMKLGIYTQSSKAVSSALLKDGALAVMQKNGKLALYTRRMAKQVDDNTISPTYEALRDKEMRAGEMMMLTQG